MRSTEAQWFGKSPKDFLTTVGASASIPTAFPHINYENMTLIDGGTMINLDIPGAYARCQQVKPGAQIILDVILCTGKTAQAVKLDPEHNHTIAMISRYQHLNTVKKNLHDLYYAMEDLKDKVTFRYVLMPNIDLPGKLVPLVCRSLIIG